MALGSVAFGGGGHQQSLHRPGAGRARLEGVARGLGSDPAGRDLRFDWIVNASGPWARQLLERSAIPVDVQLQ